MNREPVVLDGVDYGRRLPPGRHGIPPERILANQRQRLLSAAAAVFAERGYAGLAVARVIERAGVSRATFYNMFDDKCDCVLAAQRQAYRDLERAIGAAYASASGQDWPARVASAVEAALAFASKFPAEARLLLASGVASEPRLAREGVAVHERIVERLQAGASRYGGAHSPGAVSEQAAVRAAMSIAGSCLVAEEVDALFGLRADLVQIILTPYLGGDEARRIARERPGA